ncbi:MAG: hypothetical protein CVT59_06645 [Actinobacteria bacterium HGW-Actinobacteria-1]|nr:MAG: hypothetical protein CVT59_06645 [Actinobacteria bacterium HGW-Actinobacteria-1]
MIPVAERYSRRTRALVVGLLVLALFAGFAGTCVGGDTPEVQKPVNETKLRYEEFLTQMGVLGALGQVGAPWIIEPAAESTLDGDFTISGWSARPKDVTGQGAAGAYVRVFIAPAIVYETTGSYRGYEITSATRVAAVDPDTGDWSIDAASAADSFEGDCVVLAVTHMGGVAGPESPPTVVPVTSADGARKSSGDAWPAAEETIYLVTAMVRPAGESFKSGAERQLEALVDSVKRYYRDASRGRVRVEVIYEVGLKSLNVTDNKLQTDWEAYYAHIRDAVSWIPADKLPPEGSVLAYVLAQPGDDGRNENPPGRPTHSISWTDVEVSGTTKLRGSFINLPLDQYEGQDMAGVVAHEIAHGLGSFPGTSKTALPDLYQNTDGGYTPADFNNFDDMSKMVNYNVGDYFLMANNRIVNPCAYSQEWLGWLDFKDVSLDALGESPTTVDAPYLDGTLKALRTVPRVVWTEADGRKSFAVIEARSNTRGAWDSKLPAAGVVIYKMRTAKAKERLWWQTEWPRSINWCTMINSSTAEYYDVAEGYIVRRTGDMTGAASESLEVVAAPGINKADSTEAIANALVGTTMRMSIPEFNWSESATSTVRGEDDSGTVAPDLDLHAYLADGTHIGVNYETGEFENPIEGALVSGDMVMDSEWIMLPRTLVAGARFEVSANDAVAFEKAYPKAAPEGLDLAYEVQPALIDESTDAIGRGDAQSGTLTAGETASTSLSSDRELKLTPLAPGSGGPTGLSAVDPILWELGGAGLLVTIGLLVLLWPRKR